MNKVVKVRQDILENLIADHLRFCALYSGGVDNWEWYSESLHDFYDEYISNSEIKDMSYEKLAEEMMDKYIIKE